MNRHNIIPKFFICFLLIGAENVIADSNPAAVGSQERDSAKADSQTTVNTPKQTQDPQLQTLMHNFHTALAQWYESIKKMRELEIRYHNGQPDQDVARIKHFRQIENDGRTQYATAVRAATEWVEYQSEAPPEIWKFLVQATNLNGGLSWYETVAGPASAIKKLIRERPKLKIEFPSLDSYLGRSLVISGKFAEAKDALFQALQVAKPTPVDYYLFTQLDTLSQQWTQEQALHTAEAKKNNLPRVRLETTRGDVVLELYEDHAPNTVANFLTLIEQGYYDGLPFHTVIDDQFAFTGDPLEDGTGNAGYYIPDEWVDTTSRGALRGSLIMAKLADPDGKPGTTISHTASSQFMIAYLPFSVTTGQYTVFGRVVQGMPAICTLTRVNVNGNESDNSPQLPDRIVATEVLRKRFHPYSVKRIELQKRPASATTTNGTPAVETMEPAR